MSEHSFDKQHIRNRITDGLIDELNQVSQVIKCGRLGRCSWFVGNKELLCPRREQDSAVPVRFEVHANVEALSSMVKMLDTRWHTTNWESLVMQWISKKVMRYCEDPAPQPDILSNSRLRTQFERRPLGPQLRDQLS